MKIRLLQHLLKRTGGAVLLGCTGWALETGAASREDTLGLTSLRAVAPAVRGSGVAVAQAEAGGADWEVNPFAVGQSPSFVTYTSSDGSATTFPNAVGAESSHANEVGRLFFGASDGVAPAVAHLYNYEASHFYSSIVLPLKPIPARIVNQSFVFSAGNNQQAIDSAYDNYAVQFNTLFVSGAGNGGSVLSPSTAYNGLSVAAFEGASSVGSTRDNGRSKPDLTAPGVATSFSTPLVAGAAALLVQAGGANTAATDLRTLKALLLNGAVKPSSWTNSATTPLDARYGAGVLHVYNSYFQLQSGRRPLVEATSTQVQSPHPPGSSQANVGSLTGWDFSTISNTRNLLTALDRTHHYYLNLPASVPSYTLTATLVWNRQKQQTGINDLDLFLFNTANQTLFKASLSPVDNVEQLFITNLPPGRYDLQVFKNGAPGKNLTDTETYALAFDASGISLKIARQPNGTIDLSWPLYPGGFQLETTPSLSGPSPWTLLATPSPFTSQNVLNLSTSSPHGFFRLHRP